MTINHHHVFLDCALRPVLWPLRPSRHFKRSIRWLLICILAPQALYYNGHSAPWSCSRQATNQNTLVLLNYLRLKFCFPKGQIKYLDISNHGTCQKHLKSPRDLWCHPAFLLQITSSWFDVKKMLLIFLHTPPDYLPMYLQPGSNSNSMRKQTIRPHT